MTPFDGTISDADEQVTEATWWGIVGNFLLAALKFAVGYASQSASLIADGFHSLSDVISSFIVLVGIRIAQLPADEEHPYGHGKAEVIAAKMVSIILLGIGGWTMYEGLMAIRHHVAHQPPSKLAVYAAIVSILVKEALYQYKIRIGESTGSQAIIADAWHHRSDAFSSIVALLAIAGSIIGGKSWSFLDDVGAVIIGVVIAWMGLTLFLKSAKELLDIVVIGAPVDNVRTCGEAIPEVKKIEKIFVRKAGLDLLVDVHVHVDGNLTVREGHRIGHQVRRCIMNGMPAVKSVLVHIEPDMDTREVEGDKAGEQG